MNGLDLSDFLTTNTVQTFDEKQLFGNDLMVKNMEIKNGMINRVNIKEFFDHSVKLSGGILSLEEPEADKIGQKIYGSIRFEEEVDVVPSLLAVTVNGHSAADVAFINQNQEFTGDVTFEFLHAATMELGGPLQTEGLVSGINLTVFDRKRFSLSKPQEIENGAVHIHDCFIDGDLWVNSINGIILETLDRSSLAPEYDANKSYNIENMIVNGNIIVDKIGVFDMKETMENAIWLNRENYIEGTITFEEEVVFENLQVEGSFNGDDLKLLLEDIVQQGEDVEITGHKTFVNGFRVGDVKATNLNGYPLDDILTTNTEQEILGPLIIKGNAVVEGNMKLSSESKVNAMNAATFAGRYEWRDDMHILKGDIKLRNCTSIDSLYVLGSVGNVDWERVIDDIVYIMDDVEIQGNVSFNNKVVFEKDIYVIDTVDGVNLEHLFGPIGSALLRDNQGRFQGSIEYGEADDPILLFKDDVVIKGGLFVSGDIIADEVYGCNLKEWTEEAIYLDQSDEIQGTKVFQRISSSSDVLVKSINTINLERVVLLNEDQNIDQELKFKSLYIPAGSNVHVENEVNGCKLEKEFNNTVLVEGDQIISGKKTFTNKVKVRDDVITNGTINGILTENIATLDTDQEFRGLYKWNHMVALGSVNVLGYVNGEDLSRWVDLAVCSDRGRSTITGRWNVSGRVTFLGEDIPGDGTLGGVDVSQLQEITSPQSVTIAGLVNRMTENLSGVCNDIKNLRKRIISQSFLFRELEAVQILKTNDDIQSMYHFSVLEEEYLTVSYVDKCGSDLYVWDHLTTNFILMRKLALGPILEWHTLGFVQDDVVIVAKTGGIGGECIKPGYNLWYFDPQEQQAKHFQALGDFKSVKVLPREKVQNNLLYTLGHESVVTEWSLDNDGLLKKSKAWNVTGEYLTLVQEKDWEVRVVSDDKKVVELTGDISSELPDIYTIGDYEILSISEELVLGAYAVNEEAVVEGTGDSIKVFNLRDNSLFTVIPAIKPSSVVAVNFGYKRQKMFAFLEDLVILKMYEYKGALGFVQCLSIPVRSFQLLALPLKTRNLFSPHNFILAQSSRAITVFEAKMYGDPVYGVKDFTCP
ncbi:uncharacterized protein [Hetaerina americana]|uniref:uncharacterized protein isoform X2 n=1 Tax=Hetaerina americana TaxID=62018 RepID=UPI003A7F23F7